MGCSLAWGRVAGQTPRGGLLVPGGVEAGRTCSRPAVDRSGKGKSTSRASSARDVDDVDRLVVLVNDAAAPDGLGLPFVLEDGPQRLVQILAVLEEGAT